MLLRKYMSKIGIGSATVDLVLDKETYSPGEKVTGTLYIKGAL
ncbi:sporulation protein [Aeribacillus sp. FSL M8-0235]